MQSKVSLEEYFSYNIIGLVLFLIIVLCFVIYIIYVFYIKYKDKSMKKEIIPNRDIIRIKNKYLYQIDIVLDELKTNKIKSRFAYNKLSVLIRQFILETTDIDLLKSSLSEIKKKDTGVLYDLIKEYYEPEFSKNNKGDIISSINKTRKVIEEWK